MFKKLTAPTLKELFVQELEGLILSGELKIGQKLPPERELAQKMQISRSVVNDGVAEMARRGTPFAGVLFSPHYGQSYYEIFNLGNNSGIVKFSSFHNKLAMKNYLTVDFPISKVTMRLGYIGSWYQSDVNGIHDHIISHSFMVGFVKEFISFGGRRIKNPDQYRSAYY